MIFFNRARYPLELRHKRLVTASIVVAEKNHIFTSDKQIICNFA